MLSNIGLTQDLSFINYTTKDGLSSSQVYHVLQDKNGDILFATDRGITKFDGYKFETFSKENGLTNTTVFKFFPQPDGTIWCSTIDNSWFYFKNGTTNFTACPYNDIIQKGSKGGQAEDIWIDGKGKIFIGFEDLRNYLKINTEKHTVEQVPGKTPKYKDSIEVIYVFGGSKVFKYYQLRDQSTKEWKNIKTKSIGQSYEKIGFKKSEYINGSCVLSIKTYLLLLDYKGGTKELNFDSKILGIGKYDESHLWVGILGDGIKILDMEGNVKYHWLKGKSPTALLKDKNNGLWISTLDNGVFYAQNDFIRFFSTPNLYISSISPGKDKEPLISTFSGHYQLKNQVLNQLNFPGSVRANKAFYNFENGKYYKTVDSFKMGDERINGVALANIDFTENLALPIVTAAPFTFSIYKNNEFNLYQFNSRITAVENATNGMLIGGYNGLSFFSFKDLKTTVFKHSELKGRITDIKIKGKYHFIGTNEKGVVRYLQKENTFLVINAKNGLASNLINEVYPESESVLWVATNNGLDRITFNGDEFSIKHLGKEHGLIDNDVTDVYIQNSTIWIGTRSGLLSLSKFNFERISKSTQLNMFWTNVQINDSSYNYSKNISLSYQQNNLEFEFHSAFYGGTSRVKYRYKIANTKDSWHQIQNRSITLSNLNHGDYTIVLQASVDNTNWLDNQISTFFTISPPYYQTWWFRTTIVVLIAFLIFLFFRFRVLIYNKSLVKEALRLLIRKLNPQIKSFIINEQGKELRINSMDILYFKSQGNYLDIQLLDKKHTIRHKIGEIDKLVPDKIEYLRVNKSYVVRIDKITGKNIDSIFIDKIEIPIGTTYKKAVKELVI